MSRRKETQSTSVPSPTGGWNARDSVANMAPQDARFLTNWFPSTSDVLLRYGYSNWATGLGSQVETLATYAGGNNDELFAWAGSNVYDVTAGGAVGAAVVSSLTNARWQTINIANGGGNWLIAVNGTDKLLNYDGTTWTKVDAVSAHAITGVLTTSLINVHLFKHRLWFIEKDTLNAWYLGIDAIAGAATVFPLGEIASNGGYLIAAGSWTIDAGYGVDDLMAFVTNKGQVIVYRGTDPASATTWALVGVWDLGAPVGHRCFMKYAGDLLMICQDGLLPMASAVQSSRLDPRVALTDKIQSAISTAIDTFGTNFGWSMLYYAKNNMLFVNVPVSVGQQQQYVMNTITKSWCNFTGWNANCWELFQDDPYFGGNGVVCKAWDTIADNGNNINGAAAQAFSYYGSRGRLKRWTLARPLIACNGVPAVQVGLDIDYEEQSISPISTATGSSAGTWDSAVWDANVWGGELQIYRNWQGVTGVGFSASIRMTAASAGKETRWISTDLVLEIGDVL